MRIDGITTCVGERYAKYLRWSLPLWEETLDSLTIACLPEEVSEWEGSNAFGTNSFGQFFNKGAALNEAYSLSNPTDWVLAFDCDILPPKNWREIAEQKADPTKLNGAFRVDRRGVVLERPPLFVKGYFQLWNVKDPHFKLPVFENWCEHAGRCDTIFAEKWPFGWHNDLEFKLVHQGEKSKYWFGPATTGKQMRQAFSQAKNDRRQ